MSHNVYSDKSVANRNILNHIINSTYHDNLTDLTEKRYTIKQIFTFLGELFAAFLLFGGFIYLISISDALDQHMLEFLGRKDDRENHKRCQANWPHCSGADGESPYMYKTISWRKSSMPREGETIRQIRSPATKPRRWATTWSLSSSGSVPSVWALTNTMMRSPRFMPMRICLRSAWTPSSSTTATRSKPVTASS